MTVDTFQRVVKTLGDSTRLRLLNLLERHELSVADLVKVLDVPQSTVSRHLAHIKAHGLLTERRDGAFCYSRFNPPCEGAWCTAWSLARESLRDDPQIAADAEALDALLRARALGSREFFDSLGTEWDLLRKVFHDDLQRARAIGRLVPRGLRVADIGTGTGVSGDGDGTARHACGCRRSNRRRCWPPPTPSGRRCRIRRSSSCGKVARPTCRSRTVRSTLCLRTWCCTTCHRRANAIRELARIVRPGGRVVLVDFTIPEDRPQPDREWLQRDLGVIWQGFATARIREWLREAGLTNVELELHEASSDDHNLPTTFIASADRSVGAQS